MNNSHFHDQPFDDATLLKLEIFRGYIRQWLPVFLSKQTYSEVHIYDFFAGPGTDATGNCGSPLVIIEELEQYLKDARAPVAPGVDIFLHFNDNDCDKVAKLQQLVSERKTTLSYDVDFTSTDFRMALFANLDLIQRNDTANLIIMDQYGFKEVDERIFQTLIQCDTTDILFFVSSTHVRRFAKEDAVQRFINISPEKIEAISAKEIHRFICREFYQKLVPDNYQYYVVPFSIEKDSSTNIYGIIFGTSNLLGLDKFLQVCWNTDDVTGEANYNIDEEIIHGGQMSLLDECAVSKKQDKFQKEMKVFIEQRQPDNRELYRYIIENGFLPKHANPMLKTMCEEGTLCVLEIDPEKEARKNAFYLGWPNYSGVPPKVQFKLRVT
ncbi:MAG: three-Cys-motif partner protein TcmP [Candidatus Hydrogenedentes bacterium]|nr:three-Cys-motif partner protein TcmP [Candidatus Hydrogenedentota bacterium]